MKLSHALIAGSALIALSWFAFAPAASPADGWAPKPLAPSVWKAPHKPHTRIADLRTKHAGQAEWHELIVDDDYLTGVYIQARPGDKVSKRFHPDTRAWWVIMDGQVRFEIEGEPPFTAVKGSMVQVPAQTMFSLETVGDQPSLRFEVNIARARTLFAEQADAPKLPGWTYIPVNLHRKPFGYKDGNRPHINLYELAKDPKYRGSRFVHDDRAVSNVIYGYAKDLPPVDTSLPSDVQARKGHYHPECAEFWLILTGQIRYPIEYHGVVVADEGDVVYVPPFTFHAPRFWGDSASCRLAMNGFTNISHLSMAKVD